MTRRGFFVPGLVAAACGLAGCVAAARPLTVAYRNTLALPTTTTDQFGAGFTITGMSGLSYRGGATYIAVMDNSNKLVRWTVQVGSDGTALSAVAAGGVTLSQSHDFEGIALAGPGSDVVFISEEDSPAVRMFGLEAGGYLGSLPLPAVYLNRRSNLGLESLARARDGRTIWTTTEAALSVDGPIPTASAGTVVRLLRYTRSGSGYVAGPQFAYNADPLHGAPVSGGKGGVSEMVALPDGRVLLLERSLALGATLFQSRLYLLDFAGATDVSGLPSLVGQSYTPMAKTLLHSADYTNLEGLCLGPRLGPGRYAMLGIVDDGDPVSTNALVAFEISGVEEAPCYANCDGSTAAPALNVLDFACFLNTFSAGEWYGDCDQSTSPPVLNVLDFACFLNRFSAGCT